MSTSKQRKARQKAERQAWEREQQRLATARRRRTAILTVAGAVVAVGSVVVLVGILAGRNDPDPTSSAPQATSNNELLAEEAAGEAQGVAARKAMEAGEVLAEDFAVEPGTPVRSNVRPRDDDRPVACGGEAPANARASRPRYPGGPAEVLREGVDYVAKIQTSCGPITIDLLEKAAPLAVNSFVFLAEEGYYDGLEIYRDFGGIAAVQAGSGTNATGWDIGYKLPAELSRAERDGYPIGAVTTAATGPYTAGSEFYIGYGKELDSAYRTDRILSTFGQVLSGMEVIDTMDAMDRVGMGGEAFAERLFMESVTIEER
jgi:cyclophilin family peptidyl-prolyl cis-trans isomerase